jgi:uncharacterized protein
MNRSEVMLINLSEVLTKPHTTVDETVKLEMSQCDLPFGLFQIDDLKPIRVKVDWLKGKEYSVLIQTQVNLNLPCDRCLEEVNHQLNIHGDRHVNLECSEAKLTEELDESSFIQGVNLNVEQLLLSELVLNWPTKMLCNEECVGLCNVCGGSKSTQKCDCEDTSLDPRMSVVRDLFSFE